MNADEQLEFKRLSERVQALEAKAGIAQTAEPMIDPHAPFTVGQLCYAVARPYKGVGPLRLILHKANALGEGSFCYGAGEHWVTDLPSDPTKQQPQSPNRAESPTYREPTLEDARMFWELYVRADISPESADACTQELFKQLGFYRKVTP